MYVKDSGTEKLILDTAMDILFAKGNIHATTQDIADAAGVNRTLINYYFRSKKVLISTAIKTTYSEFKKKSNQILLSDLPFRKKTEEFIGDFLTNLYKYPYLDSFMIAELTRQGTKKKAPAGIRMSQPDPMTQYLKEIKAEMKAGTIPGNNPVHFMMNMFSMMVYPVVMKPLHMNLFKLNESQYDKLLNERKQIIMKILIPGTDI